MKFTIFFVILFLSFNVSAEQKEIETIIANGMGTSIQGAAQNAAENALTQAVGSFIDATTTMEKKTEIRDGVVLRSSMINKDIKNYSQGSIQYFEILDTAESGGIFRITARVDVRIEDFRAYIKELSSGTQKIRPGLFAQMKAEKDNAQERASLVFNNILLPIMAGEVHDIEIQEPISLSKYIETCSDIEEEFFYSLGNRSEYLNSAMRDRDRKVGGELGAQGCGDPWKNNPNKSNIVVFEFSISLRDEFFENMKNTFENISNSKREFFGNADINNYLGQSGGFRSDEFIVVNNNKGDRESTAVTYVLDDFYIDFKPYVLNKIDSVLPNYELKYPYSAVLSAYNQSGIRDRLGVCGFSNSLVFKILDRNANVIKSLELQTCGTKDNRGIIPGMSEYPQMGLYTNTKLNSKVILSKRNYFAFVGLSSDQLEKAANVELSYLQDKYF